jgi:Domain of unknown function (DUF4785)
MQNLKSAALAACISLGLAAAAHGAELRLAAPGAGDQIVERVAAVDLRAQSAHLDRNPVSLSWALDPAEALNDKPLPFVQQSREYWLDASEAELRRGIALPTTAEAALIRITPKGNNSHPLQVDDLSIRSNGVAHDGRSATQSVADAASLRAAGMEVSDGTIVARLAPVVGKGRIELAAPTASGNYLIHVFEPASSTVLNLGTAHDTVPGGKAVQITASLQGATAQAAKGMLTAPDGHTQPFELSRRADGSWQAEVVPDVAHATGPGLWEVHVFASGGDKSSPVLRDAKTAFAVARPTAKLSGQVSRDAKDAQSLRLDFGVQVASASRYQIAAVLYGTAADGTRKPAAYAQSATWLEAGNGRVALSFDAAALKAAGLSAPYELRDLRLSNQADLSLLERRERALDIR